MSSDKYSVIANGISKCYKIYSSPKQKLLDLIVPSGAGKEFYALKDITFQVNKGDIVGIIGLNGSGKSTLSNILGGVSIPSKGSIKLNGESALIAINLGLNKFLTGMENIELKCTMMGFKKEEIDTIKQEIIDFADIGNFITQPIRTYSSGMRSRLGFAISVYTNPDILVIDEALSVGDPTFTQKCLDKMNEFKDRGKTIFFVSHSAGQIKQFCTKVLWLEYGCLRDYGDVKEILPKYDAYIKFVNSMTEHEKKEYKKIVLNHQEHALLNDFKLFDPKHKKVKLKGRVIKQAYLINKLYDIKIVPYKLDYLTVTFGFIPSLIRKRTVDSMMILVAQLANLFIIPQPYNIITNFIITGIIGLFTGKIYTTYLIEKKGYIDYSIWKLSNNDDKLKEDIVRNNEITINNRNSINKVMMIVALVSIIILPIILNNYQSTYLNSIGVVNQQTAVVDGNTAIIILDKNSNGKQQINGINILNQDNETGKLKEVFYPGNLYVKHSNYYMEIDEIINLDNIEDLNEVFKENFNIDINRYLTIDSTTYEIDFKKDSNQSELIIDFLNSDERGVNGKKTKILKGKTNIKDEDLTSFYNKFKGVKELISEVVPYKEVVLGTIIEEDKLISLNRLDLKDYKIRIIDDTKVQEIELIKDLLTEYENIISQ